MLADVNADGKMDRREFTIAMFLIKRKLQGYELPTTLPLSLLRSSDTATSPPAAPVSYPPQPPASAVSFPGQPPAVPVSYPGQPGPGMMMMPPSGECSSSSSSILITKTKTKMFNFSKTETRMI